MAQQEPQPADDGIADLVGRLVEDGKAFAEAELDYYRLLARGKLREARAGLWWGAAAASLALATAIALVVGLVLTLIPLVGPGFATLIVVLGIGGISAVMGWLAWVHVKRVMKRGR